MCQKLPRYYGSKLCQAATVCKYAGYNNTCTYKLYPKLSSVIIKPEEIHNKIPRKSIIKPYIQFATHPSKTRHGTWTAFRPTNDPPHPFSHPLLPKELCCTLIP
jgi:hypothetical protein